MDSKEEVTKRKYENDLEIPAKRIKESEMDVRISKDVELNKPLCKYGEKCYQKNLPHLQKFRHPHRENAESAVLKLNESTENDSKPTHSGNLENKKDSVAQETVADKSFPNIVENTTDLVDNINLPQPKNVQEWIKQNFLVDMPHDFYQLWDFCKSITPEKPLDAFKDSLGFRLVGPFRLLDQPLEDMSKFSSTDFTEWRFYYDPPELQTVLVDVDDLSKGFHIGYFRDSPSEIPALVVSNTEREGSILTPVGENLFSALSHEISSKLKKTNPFKQSKLMILKKQLEEWTEKNDILTQTQDQVIKKRKKNMVARTFFECGIVVPVNKKTKVGYRKIPETNDNIKKICQKIRESSNSDEENKSSDPLQELVTYVQYANDECDYGMGLELGLDLLAFGGEVFHPTILHLLGVAYELLERQEFIVILKAHLKDRRKLSEISAE